MPLFQKHVTNMCFCWTKEDEYTIILSEWRASASRGTYNFSRGVQFWRVFPHLSSGAELVFILSFKATERSNTIRRR